VDLEAIPSSIFVNDDDDELMMMSKNELWFKQRLFRVSLYIEQYPIDDVTWKEPFSPECLLFSMFYCCLLFIVFGKHILTVNLGVLLENRVAWLTVSLRVLSGPYSWN